MLDRTALNEVTPSTAKTTVRAPAMASDTPTVGLMIAGFAIMGR